MKKMIISVLACIALVLGACFAWLCYKDVLAVALLISALVPSVLFNEGLNEFKASRHA